MEADAGAIVRLKREFRSLANLVHPNLVALDRLRSVEGRWFFTMELVDGRHFDDYVRGGPTPRAEGRSSPSTNSMARIGATAEPGAEPDSLDSPQQLERLRASLAQLTRGLTALHQAGKLHRDIKPLNVLVTEAGRVVLVDFGLVIDLDSEARDRPDKRQVAGTIAYMSPEQCEGRPLTAASDWYSVGVMLFETLTGRRPFEGAFRDQLESKRRGDLHVRPGEVPDDAADLVALFRSLLRPDPEDRRPGLDVLRAIAPESPWEPVFPPPPHAGKPKSFRRAGDRTEATPARLR